MPVPSLNSRLGPAPSRAGRIVPGGVRRWRVERDRRAGCAATRALSRFVARSTPLNGVALRVAIVAAMAVAVPGGASADNLLRPFAGATSVPAGSPEPVGGAGSIVMAPPAAGPVHAPVAPDPAASALAPAVAASVAAAPVSPSSPSSPSPPAAAHAGHIPVMTAGLPPGVTPGVPPSAPWRVVGLPHQRKPFTRFSVAELAGHVGLRVEASLSYGNLVHPLNLPAGQALGPSWHVSWQGRVDAPNPAADLHTRGGDDTAVKVCVLWELPLDNVPFVERQMLRLLRSQSDVPLPAATVCYVWDAHLPRGSELDSAFTRRLRYVVLRSGDDPLHQWTAERRDIVADFHRLFGAEAPELPPIAAVAVGADADNTQGHSLAWVADLVLEP